MTLTVASLCSGYEATSLGLTLAGWDHRLAFVADPDPAAAKALARHHPDVPNLGDITRVAWDELGLTGEIDLLTAGFPCTDISAAGRRAGLAPGTRSGIWANVADAIDVLRPRLVLIENVAALLSTPANRSTDGADSDLEPRPAGLGGGASRSLLRAAGAVVGDLASMLYDAVGITVSAADVGAPHLRKRVFILAWPAAYPPRFGHRHGGQEGVGGVPAAAVAGGAQAGELSLLPTPKTSDADRGDCPSERDRRSPSLVSVGALLPTPRARDGKGRDPNPRGVDLNEAVALLPTPNAALGRGTGTPSAETAAQRFADGKRFLDDAVALLPTPRATDGTKGGPNQRGSSGDMMLPSAVMQLLPTPTATPYGNNQSPSAGVAVRPSLDGLVRDADRWGDYGPAIARWEQVIGRPAPEPTESGKNGQPRLSARFVEWMQGLPDGYVTAVPGISRNDALRLLGNSNPPQQYAAAITQLAAIVAVITAKEAA